MARKDRYEESLREGSEEVIREQEAQRRRIEGQNRGQIPRDPKPWGRR